MKFIIFWTHLGDITVPSTEEAGLGLSGEAPSPLPGSHLLSYRLLHLNSSSSFIKIKITFFTR